MPTTSTGQLKIALFPELRDDQFDGVRSRGSREIAVRVETWRNRFMSFEARQGPPYKDSNEAISVGGCLVLSKHWFDLLKLGTMYRQFLLKFERGAMTVLNLDRAASRGEGHLGR